jgi:transposase
MHPEKVWLVLEPTDMRLGAEGLSQRVSLALGRSPCDGTAYAFSNRRRNRLKLLVWDGTGVWLAQRRLHQGHFVWPTVGETVCTLSEQEWDWLTKGVDWRLLAATPPAHWKVA